MNHIEALIQCEIVKRFQELGVFCFSVPNEGAGGNMLRQGRLVSMGLKSGVSDLVVWIGELTVYLEVKAPGGKQSPAQKKFQTRCEESGRSYELVFSLEDALNVLAKYARV